MSGIRVINGYGTAELEAIDLVYAEGATKARYRPQDLVLATVQTLRAAGATNYADAIESAMADLA